MDDMPIGENHQHHSKSMMDMPEHDMGQTMNHGMNHDMSHGMNHSMMKMYFHGGYEEVILFDFWRIHGPGGLIVSMIVCFLLSILYEAIKFTREIVFRKYNAPFIEQDVKSKGSPREEEERDPSKPKIRLALVFKNYIWSKSHLLLTLLHVLQVVISYALMLIFMTYNSWLCLSVILGTGTGYFIFGWKRSSILDVSDHCH
uniref:Copper transport protein n=1 Tax=Caligus clemensi TaxID=344056 RepID=C1C210_CALCM|nr:High affinity copper uptake protein 1 [Caligus clemensi]